MSNRAPITYRDSGVDIDAGDELVERIKPLVRRSMRPEVLGGLGGFGALVEVPVDRYRRPVLVSGTDGVGTKLRLAIDTGRHDTIGIDLVAMCANDVVVQGAEPLFFLDYYATGHLDVAVAESVIRGIVEGCVQAGAALVGGETAEMPGMYAAERLRPGGILRWHRGEGPHHRWNRDAGGRCRDRPALLRPSFQWLLTDPQADPGCKAGAGHDARRQEAVRLLLAPTRIYVKPCWRCSPRSAFTVSRISPVAGCWRTYLA